MAEMLIDQPFEKVQKILKVFLIKYNNKKIKVRRKSNALESFNY